MFSSHLLTDKRHGCILDLFVRHFVTLATEIMASTDSFETAQRAILAEVAKQDHILKHVSPPGESLSTTQAKVLIEVQGGKYELSHVENPPKDGLSDAAKRAYLEEKCSK
jgi:hypothetical protein